MGNKSSLLRGDLGRILGESVEDTVRFVDLFAGSGSVSHFVAEQFEIPVLSVDLQHYSKVFALSVTGRVEPLDLDPVLKGWISSVRSEIESSITYESLDLPSGDLTKEAVHAARTKSTEAEDAGFITRHYGGHYFSAQQAHCMDVLYQKLPAEEPHRTVGLAALLRTASVCAAAPGHTAQPFQPTPKLLRFIEESWKRDVVSECERQVHNLATRHAKVLGEARVADAQSVITDLGEGDLVFCDPPYSEVQYSRFYHVLEGIARGGWSEVFGAGRAPGSQKRESSDFSKRSQSAKAMAEMLGALWRQSCNVMITFPNKPASNGLSSTDIQELAGDSWNVVHHVVNSTHSTLGGSSGEGGRGGRRILEESVLVMEPRKPTPTFMIWTEKLVDQPRFDVIFHEPSTQQKVAREPVGTRR